MQEFFPIHTNDASKSNSRHFPFITIFLLSFPLLLLFVYILPFLNLLSLLLPISPSPSPSTFPSPVPLPLNMLSMMFLRSFIKSKGTIKNVKRPLSLSSHLSLYLSDSSLLSIYLFICLTLCIISQKSYLYPYSPISLSFPRHLSFLSFYLFNLSSLTFLICLIFYLSNSLQLIL